MFGTLSFLKSNAVVFNAYPKRLLLLLLLLNEAEFSVITDSSSSSLDVLDICSVFNKYYFLNSLNAIID